MDKATMEALVDLVVDLDRAGVQELPDTGRYKGTWPTCTGYSQAEASRRGRNTGRNETKCRYLTLRK